MSRLKRTPPWRDTTSYSQGKERTPTCWTLEVGGLHITVVKGHIYHPGVWILQCEPWFREKELKNAGNDETAQAMALTLVREKVSALYAAF